MVQCKDCNYYTAFKHYDGNYSYCLRKSKYVDPHEERDCKKYASTWGRKR